MRLGQILLKWPKNPPRGLITIGKNQMVRKVESKHLDRMAKDIAREKQNIFLCMNPAATVQQERALYSELDKEESKLAFELSKALNESYKGKPIRINGHYEVLKSTGTWQKF